MAKTLPAGHKHVDSRAKWTTPERTNAAGPDSPHVHEIDIASFSAADVKALLAIAGGGGGTTPVPNPPPGPTPDVTAPVISVLTISAITTTGATASWSLSEAGNGQAEYGPTSLYGLTTTIEASYLTAHSQSITGLTPGATYHVRVKSCDAAGNCAYSSDRTFTTIAVTPTPPPVSGDYPADTTLSYVALNADGDPGYLVEGTDSTWGTKYRRITNVTPRRNLYPKQMVENLDGSILFLGFGFRFLDGNSYADLGQHATGVEYPVWSNVNRDYMYGCSDGQNVLKRFSVAANAWSVRHTFVSYGHLSLGNYEGNISATDTRIALIYNTNAARTGTWGVVIYDPVNDAVISSLAIGTGAASEPNNCNISRSGAYVTVQHGADGGGTFQGTRLYNSADFSFVRAIQGAGQARSHGDMLRDASHADIYVYAKSNNAVSHRLSDGTETTLLPAGNALIAGASGHVSGQAIDRDGWVYLSGSGTNTTAGRDQLIAAKTDGSQTVEVFGFAHCAPSEPLMAPNRAGTKVFYGRPVSGSMFGWVAGMAT